MFNKLTRLPALLVMIIVTMLWSSGAVLAADRPNILWITCEDMSPNLGCFGDAYSMSPNIDRLAERGVRYTQAFSTSGVCAPSRSCLITGVFPSSLGSQFMRCKATLPSFVKCFPEYLREAGYYCTNNSKTDYNFDHPKSAWDESSNKAHWRNRPDGKPFFSVFNDTVTHESQIRSRGAAFLKATHRLKPEQRHDPTKVTLPPIYPDTPEARRDWANYLDCITTMDSTAGDLLKLLGEDGLADDTIVFFFSDHGIGLPRAKRWLYDTSLHVPLIIHFPAKFQHLAPGKPGSTTDRMVSFVDFAPTVLSLSGVKIPEHMQGIPFLGSQAGPPRDYIYGIRDRMDERYDLIRAVRDRRFKYIRNYMPGTPWSQFLNYAEQGPTLQSMRRLHGEGKLTPAQARFFAPTKPPEELYDTKADPWELRNLAADPAHRETLERLRREHLRWQTATLDLGLLPEAELHERSRGSAPYELIRNGNLKYPRERILQAIDATYRGAPAIDDLVVLLKDDDPAVRYWAIVGLTGLRDAAKSAEPFLTAALTDRSATVRVAACEALRHFDQHDPTLSVLTEALSHPSDWVRLAAAISLDHLGPAAKPAREQLERAKSDKNQYVIRVVEHALSALP
ncbi:MAG: sulfatase-like hydrolase/transferase [Planctomycetales bacterium]|nr:sulfatase-like hydrolase/transferase [Planctomycetales bacterium]